GVPNIRPNTMSATSTKPRTICVIFINNVTLAIPSIPALAKHQNASTTPDLIAGSNTPAQITYLDRSVFHNFGSLHAI
ncbi:MAG: hypothetical protein ABF291_16585, partial [Desulfobacterales bacterium]